MDSRQAGEKVEPEVRYFVRTAIRESNEEVNRKFDDIKDQMTDIRLVWAEQTGYLKSIAEDTKEMKQNVLDRTNNLEDRMDEMEKSNEIYIVDKQEKTKVISAVLGSGLLLSLIGWALNQYAPFPF